MKILVITRNAWDDTNAIGNTLSNFFAGVDHIEFAAIYFRSAMPNNSLCRHYFKTSEIDVMRKWFHPSAIGKQFDLSAHNTVNEKKRSSVNEKKIVRIVQKYGLKVAYRLSDYLWYSEKWINDNLDDFIKSFSPDMMVTFVKSAPQYYLTVKYLRQKYNIPLFSWIADDEYTGLLKNRAKREIRNLQYILDESVVVTGCSKELCTYYNAVFGCNAKPLYKSCDLSLPIKKNLNDPITLVYAGNLVYGRLDIICSIADALEQLASSGFSAVLEVYSNTELLPQEEQRCFKARPFVKYMGKKEYSYIKQRLSEADIVLHVESFENDQILKTKYSFSTKIIDYLQSGSVILAVGPQELASIRYIRDSPGAFIVDEIQKLSEKLKIFLGESDRFSEMAAQIRDYAQRHHSFSVASENMRKIIKETSKGEV